MRIASFTSLALWLLLVLPVTSFAQKGTLVVTGGGKRAQQSFKNAVANGRKMIFDRYQLTEVSDVHAVFIATPSARYPGSNASAFERQLKLEGVTHVTRILTPPPASEDEATAKTILDAEIIGISGGDQELLMAGFEHLPLTLAAIQQRLDDGAFVMVTSASAAAAPEQALMGRDPRTGRRTVLKPGMALVKGFSIDTHFVIRNREKYHFVEFLETHGIPRGMGIDEDATIEFHNGIGTVMPGQQVVAYVTGDRGTWRFSLWAGDQIDLNTFKPVKMSQRTECNLAFTTRLSRR